MSTSLSTFVPTTQTLGACSQALGNKVAVGLGFGL